MCSQRKTPLFLVRGLVLAGLGKPHFWPATAGAIRLHFNKMDEKQVQPEPLSVSFEQKAMKLCDGIHDSLYKECKPASVDRGSTTGNSATYPKQLPVLRALCELYLASYCDAGLLPKASMVYEGSDPECDTWRLQLQKNRLEKIRDLSLNNPVPGSIIYSEVAKRMLSEIEKKQAESLAGSGDPRKSQWCLTYQDILRLTAECARSSLASMWGIEPDLIFFTKSGTEAEAIGQAFAQMAVSKFKDRCESVSITGAKLLSIPGLEDFLFETLGNEKAGAIVKRLKTGKEFLKGEFLNLVEEVLHGDEQKIIEQMEVEAQRL